MNIPVIVIALLFLAAAGGILAWAMPKARGRLRPTKGGASVSPPGGPAGLDNLPLTAREHHTGPFSVKSRAVRNAGRACGIARREVVEIPEGESPRMAYNRAVRNLR